MTFEYLDLWYVSLCIRFLLLHSKEAQIQWLKTTSIY